MNNEYIVIVYDRQGFQLVQFTTWDDSPQHIERNWRNHYKRYLVEDMEMTEEEAQEDMEDAYFVCAFQSNCQYVIGEL